MQEKHYGTVIQFDKEKEVGAITCPDFPERVKFEYKGSQEIEKGSRVSFETLYALGKPLAVFIEVLPEKKFREHQAQFDQYVEEEYNRYSNEKDVRRYIKEAIEFLPEPKLKRVFMLVRTLDELD